MIFLRLAVVSLFLTLIMPSVAMACQCMPPSDELAQKSFEDSDIVVNGIVTQVSGGWGSQEPMIKLQINTIYKGGNIPDIITVNYNENSAACGNDFEPNQSVTIALYDTRSLMVTEANTRGYGFRAMISCHQYQVRHYVDTMMGKKALTNKQTEKDK